MIVFFLEIFFFLIKSRDAAEKRTHLNPSPVAKKKGPKALNIRKGSHIRAQTMALMSPKITGQKRTHLWNMVTVNVGSVYLWLGWEGIKKKKKKPWYNNALWDGRNKVIELIDQPKGRPSLCQCCTGREKKSLVWKLREEGGREREIEWETLQRFSDSARKVNRKRRLSNLDHGISRCDRFNAEGEEKE